MKFCTWNVRSLYMFGSLRTAARELARYNLDLVGAQEVRWDKTGTTRAEDYIFIMEEERKLSMGKRIFCTQENSNSSLDS
jgi:exonuclease III